VLNASEPGEGAHKNLLMGTIFTSEYISLGFEKNPSHEEKLQTKRSIYGGHSSTILVFVGTTL
jgi:hypothetical protein